VRDLDVGMVVISHDLSVLADVCDRVMVMYAGRAVEVDQVVAWVRARRPGLHVVTGSAGTGRADCASVLAVAHGNVPDHVVNTDAIRDGRLPV